MAQIDITLYGEQLTLFQDWLNTDKHCIDIVPVGSGKTFLSSVFLPIAASDPKYHRGKDCLYVAPTREMIKSLVWNDLKRSCREYFGIPESDINNSELTIKFPNGIYIRCKSAEQKENLRGMNVGVAVLDEAALYSEESLLEITNRLRPRVGQPDTAGRLIVISTPNGAGPLYTLFNNALAFPERYIVRHMDYTQMRSGNLKFIEEQRRILSPLKFAKDYLCAWESVEDQFFMSWDNSMCHDVVDMGGDIYTFHDFNKRRMCAIAAQVRGDSLEIIHSYAIPDCDTEGICRAIRSDFPVRRINAIIDMSGTQLNRDTTSPFGVTDRTIMERYGFTIVNNRNSNPLIADTDNSCNAYIARRGLKVSSTDTLLLEALNTYHFEDGHRKRLVKYTEQRYAHIDGLGDALRYGIHHLFPVQHAAQTIPEYVTQDARLTRRPGEEYLPQSPLYPGGPTFDELLGGLTEQPDYMEP